MNHKTLASLLTASFIIATTPLAFAEGGVDFSGTVESTWGAAAPWTDADTSAGHFTLGDTTFNGTLDAYFAESSAYADATVGYDALTKKINFSLGELWLDYTSSHWGIRVGRQKAAWGKADGIDIANIICPTDMSSLSALTADDSKLAVDALRLSATGTSFTADAWWIPFFTPAALPLQEENPLRKFLVPSSVDFTVEALGTTLTLPVTVNAFTEPELSLWNGEYGAKLSGYFPLCDVSVYGFYGWDDIPLLDYGITYGEANPSPALPNGITVGAEYKRVAMLALDAAVPLGQTVLRTEAAFFPQRHFQKSAEKIIGEKLSSTQDVETSERHNQLSALLGLDWMPEGWTLTAQYFCDCIFCETENLERKNNYEHGATLSVSKTLLNETLELSVAGIVNFNDFDSLISPQVNYSISDQITFSGGAYIFLPGPENDGKYGAYKDLTTLYVKGRFSF